MYLGTAWATTGWQAGQWTLGKRPDGDFVIVGPNAGNTNEQYLVLIAKGGETTFTSNVVINGKVYANSPGVENTINTCNSGAINIGAVSLSVGQFAPYITGYSRITDQGYIDRFSLGSYRDGPNNWGSVFLGVGGADAGATSAFLFRYDGLISRINGDISFNDTNYYGNIIRLRHSTGCLVGSYNSVGPNDNKTNPIYTIGSSYMPTDTSLGHMYGIGYSHNNFWGPGKGTGWGLYVAEDGLIRATILSGGIWTAGSVTAPGGLYGRSNTESRWVNLKHGTGGYDQPHGISSVTWDGRYFYVYFTTPFENSHYNVLVTNISGDSKLQVYLGAWSLTTYESYCRIPDIGLVEWDRYIFI